MYGELPSDVLDSIKDENFRSAAEKLLEFRVGQLDEDAVADITQRMETKWKELYPLKLSNGYTLDDIAKEVLDSIENEFHFD